MQKHVFVRLARRLGCALDKKGKFVYFSHNKVAQTSIVRTLLRKRAVGAKNNLLVWTAYRKLQEFRYEARPPFVFTIVRNPYTRVASAFMYLRRIGVVAPHMDFVTFVRDVVVPHREYFDPHLTPQAKFGGHPDELGFDYVGRLETLASDWAFIASHIDASQELPHANQGQPVKMMDLYDEEAQRLVLSVYRGDFELFGYPESLPSDG